MIIKALDNGKWCVWNGFAHKAVDSMVFNTIAEAEKHLKDIENEMGNK